MMIVDSNTWADFFNGVESPHAARLDEALAAEDDIGLVPVIIAEVLQGFRTEAGFRRARQLFTALPAVRADVARHVRAARLFRSLRAKGVPVRGAADCVIAQTCLDLGAELLSPDRDFENIRRHTRLRLWRP